MDAELIAIRVLHVLPGAFWVGAAVVIAFIVEPRLNALGPAISRPAIRSIHRVFGPVMMVAILVTIGAGFSLAKRTPGRSVGEFFETDWGWAIGMGAVFAFVSFGLGMMTGVMGTRIARFSESIEEETPDQTAQLARMYARLTLVGRLAAVASVIAVGLMASARWV